MDRVMDWVGLDYMTFDSGVNPLAASYVGAPHQVRGVDPSAYAAAAMATWQGITAPDAPTPTTEAGNIMPDWFGTYMTDKAGAVKTFAVASLLGLVVVTAGLALLIWGRD